MTRRVQEAQVAGAVIQELRTERERVLRQNPPGAWQEQMEQELAALLRELNVSPQKAQQEIQAVAQSDDPVARLESFVAIGRVFREMNEMEQLGEELGLE